MADIEMFKVIMNGGSFGLMAIFVCWVLFKASPALKDSIERMNADHDTAVKAMVADHRNTITAMADAHRTSIATLASEFRASLAATAKECRDERAELLERADAHADRMQVVLNNMAAAQTKPRSAPDPR